jgi:LETM1 and EF-hand domain-containing protein 1, mitochondrial
MCSVLALPKTSPPHFCFVIQDPEKSPSASLIKRIRSMLEKIDAQLQQYDDRVGSSLQLISCDAQGKISIGDLTKALAVIKHTPDEEVVKSMCQKLDPDSDGFVELDHVLGLVSEEGLGVIVEKDEEAKALVGEGREIRSLKPRKEDIVSE